MRRTLRGAAAAGALAITFSGVTACSDGAAPASTGTLSVMLTDAPFPYDQVERADIFVMRIDAKLAEATEQEAAEVDDEHESQSGGTSLSVQAGKPGDAEPLENHDPRHGWVTIATPNQSYNMLDLQNGQATNLGQVTLPTGTYRGFRLILDTDRSSVTLTDGTVLNGNSTPGIVWPSAGRTGIKVKLGQPISLVENGTVMVLDFDLGNSFVLRGNTIEENGLLFKPVIRASARDITGSLAGTVSCGASDGTSAPVPAASVELLKAGTALDDATPENVVATTSADDAGEYRFGFVLPGSYALRATRPAGDVGCAEKALVDNVAVTDGTSTSASIELPATP